MIYIPHDFPSFNEIIAIYKSGKIGYANKIKQEYTNIAKMYFKKAQKVTNYPIKVTFTWYIKNRARDLDGFNFAKKCILDGAVKAGIFANDNLTKITIIEDRAIKSSKTGVMIEWKPNV